MEVCIIARGSQLAPLRRFIDRQLELGGTADQRVIINGCALLVML